nr:dockerin type I domain-containing protein [Pirellulaceae bacterium]
VTLTLEGGKLTDGLSYQVVGPDAVVHQAINISAVNSSLVYATFDLSGLPIGAYDVQAVSPGATATFSGALAVAADPARPVESAVSGPAFFRPHRVVRLTVDYVNPGGADAVAPLLFLESDNGQFRLPGQTAWMPDAFQIVGINHSGPAGVLPPGYRGTIAVEFLPKTFGSGVTSRFQVSLADPAEQVDWAGLKDLVHPRFQPADSWDVIYQSFLAKVGTTYGQLQQVLAADAGYLSELGPGVTDARRLLSFEFQLADAFGVITQRYRLGAFGRGVPDPTDAAIQTDFADNAVIRHNGKVRFFARQADGNYEGLPGDWATLTRVGDVYQLREKDGRIVAFRSDGRLDYMQDSAGNRLTADYTEGRLSGFTDSSGDSLTYAYAANGRIIQATDAVGRVTTYSYDASGEHLVQVSNAAGSVSYSWLTGQGAAREHALASVTYADGTHLYFEYDAQGRLIRHSRDGGAEPVNYAYDAFGGVTVTDAAGRALRAKSNEFSQPGVLVDALGRTGTAVYDASHNLVRRESAGRMAMTFSYDAIGNPVEMVDPLGRRTGVEYDSDFHHPTSVVYPSGDSLELQYDSQGRLLSARYANSASSQYQYDAQGNLIQLTNTQGQTFQLTYNAHNRLASATGPDGSTTTFTYDAHRNLATATDASGTTAYTYDAADRLTAISYPGGRSLAITFDAAGRRSRTVDQDGVTVQYTYDVFGRLDRLSDAGGATLAAYRYDPAGRVAQIDLRNGTTSTYAYTDDGLLAGVVNRAADDSVLARADYAYDDLGRMTNLATLSGSFSWAYDAYGRVTSVVKPTEQSAYQYDAAGNLAEWTRNPGRSTRYAYDTHNLLVRKDLPDGTVQTFTYDVHWNLASMTDATGTTTFARNDAGWLTSVHYPSGQSLAFTYDAAGRRTRMATGDGFSVQYAYDAQGRLGRLSDDDGQTIVAYGYDAAGRLARKDQGNGTFTTYAYLPKDLLGSVINSAPDGSVQSRFDYTYDSLDRPASMTTLAGTFTYAYDALGQLTSATLPGGRTVGYEYDAAGNRVAVIDNGVTTTYAVNGVNQCTAAGPVTYQYDADGNLVSKTDAAGTTHYAYDSESHLVSIVSPTDTWTYQYNGLGQRTAVVRNGQRTEFLVDPAGLGDVVGEYRAGSELVANYAYGFGLASRTDAAGAAAYYNFDGTGNTVELTGLTGAAVNTYSYLPFGEKLTATGAAHNPFTYGGQWGVADRNEGLYFMRARWYDPALGRFTQPDPIGLSGGDSNLYRYAGNSPIARRDPSGQRTISGDSAPVSLPLPPGVSSLSPSEFTAWAQTAVNADPQVVQQVMSQLSPDASQTASVVFSQMQNATGQITNHVNGNGIGQLAGTPWGSLATTFANTPGFVGAGTTDVPTMYATWATVLGGGHVDFGQAYTHFQEQWAAVGHYAGTDITVLFAQNDHGTDIPWTMVPLVGDQAQTAAMWHMSGVMWNYLAQQTQQPQRPQGGDLGDPDWEDLFDLGGGDLDDLFGGGGEDFWGDFGEDLFDWEGGDFGSDFGDDLGDFGAGMDPAGGGAFGLPAAETGSGDTSGGFGVPGGGLGGNSSIGQQVAGVDPNDIIGPAGLGPEHFVADGQTLSYVLHFENLPSASGAAQVVAVTHQLGPHVDWSTFQLGDLGYGDTRVAVPAGLSVFSTRVDAWDSLGLLVEITAGLDVQAGLVRWTFASLDPVTQAVTEDPLAGFLPPNKTAPQGEGWATYSVRPKAGLTTGTQVDAAATIYFDGVPLDAPAIFNTLDAGPPSSHVLPLADQSGTAIPVHWTGADDAGGAGVARYDVYVSVDRGPFQLWQRGTAGTSGTFTGEAGRTYAFYSVATDQVGHVEIQAAVPDAETRVVANPWHHYANPYDVDGADGVTPLDVLIVINYINAHPGDTALPSPPASGPPYYDVSNGDGITAQDVLLVINYINSRLGGSSAGEASDAGAPHPEHEADHGVDAVPPLEGCDQKGEQRRLEVLAPKPPLPTAARFGLQRVHDFPCLAPDLRDPSGRVPVCRPLVSSDASPQSRQVLLRGSPMLIVIFRM